MEIKIIENLLSNIDYINAWSRKESFCISSMDLNIQKDMPQVIIVETKGSQGITADSDAVFNKFKCFVKEIIFKSCTHNYLFKVEHKIKPKSRLRSYKGIFPSGLNANEYLNVEIDHHNNYSLIAGLVKLSDANFESLFDFFYDSSTCFIISSMKEILDRKFTIDTCNKFVGDKDGTYINYLDLCMEKIVADELIYRVGGDGGDEEVSLQIFCSKENISKISIIASSCL